jgi:hypothetical protein
VKDPRAHSKFRDKVVKELKSKGCWVLSVHGHKLQKVGVSDLLVIGRSWKGFLELKTGNAVCSPVQKEFIEKMVLRNFPTYVLRWDPSIGASGAVIIENRQGEMLNVVCLKDGLWEWLKNPHMIL